MVKISSDLKKFKSTHVTPRGYHHVLVELKTSSREPDQQLQRWQRVRRHLGVQQALVLVQINYKRSRKHSRLKISLLKNIFRPFWSLTYLFLLLLF